MNWLSINKHFLDVILKHCLTWASSRQQPTGDCLCPQLSNPLPFSFEYHPISSAFIIKLRSPETNSSVPTLEIWFWKFLEESTTSCLLLFQKLGDLSSIFTSLSSLFHSHLNKWSNYIEQRFRKSPHCL